MSIPLTGFLIGAFFGAFLFLGGLANPDKIVGTLRLKDFHAMRTIAVFVLVGMAGTWVLCLLGLANFSVKPAAILSVLLGGALLGIGFGLTGYCPGTGLACAVSGQMDALIAVAGMFAGALVYILIHPSVAGPLDRVANYGKVTLSDVTGVPNTVWVLVFGIGGTVALVLTRGKSKEAR